MSSDDREQSSRSLAAESSGVIGIEPDRLAALVRECIAMMKSGDIVDLELRYEKLKLRLRAREDTGGLPPSGEFRPTAQRSTAVTSPILADEHVITAPMIGTFYHAAAPGEPAFVVPGDRVEEGQTVGIIEAMKIMNEIAADRAGMVEEILAANGQTVEYGSPLIRLSPDAG